MYIWGITKKYKSFSWSENFLSGHIFFGPVTIFGDNAMNFGVSIQSKKYGSINFRLPLPTGFFQRFKWHPLYFYVSPNGTPGSSTFYIGKSRNEGWKAKIRKELYGHNFKQTVKQHSEMLSLLDSFDNYDDYLLKQKNLTRSVLFEKFKPKKKFLINKEQLKQIVLEEVNRFRKERNII